MAELTLVHLTDCHLSPTERVKKDDIKMPVAGIEHPRRIELLKHTLSGIKAEIDGKRLNVDAVIVSGDGTLRGEADGQEDLRRCIYEELQIDAPLIVVTPGNHDVVKGSPPSSSERYNLFKGAWFDGTRRDAVIPFLDGVHSIASLDPAKHYLKDPSGAWAIFPINTANWCQVTRTGSDDKDIKLLHEHLSRVGDEDLKKALASICSYDIARVSDQQFKALKRIVKHAGDVRLKIAVLHHHMLPVNSREEFKPFSDITNLGALRQALAELGIKVVLHGHKHSETAFYDYVATEKIKGLDPLSSYHRMLVISGGTLQDDPNADGTLRLVTFDEIEHAPRCTIETWASRELRATVRSQKSQTFNIWSADDMPSGPLSICGRSIDEVYARAQQTLPHYKDRTVICTVDFDGHTDAPLPIPANYPRHGDCKERIEWFNDTVNWWQLPSSITSPRIPYAHGGRLRRYGGHLNQIDRIVALISKAGSTSKSIAVLVEPERDFQEGSAFPSFCLLQFCLRDGAKLDCLAYYRTQEFDSWWPINVAELRYLQLEVCKKTRKTAGKITTITPLPRIGQVDIRPPANVAVPLLDQWADTYPDRIAEMAFSKFDDPVLSQRAAGYWKRCLDDIERVISAPFHQDGVPVAIEGLELLLKFAEAGQCEKKIVDQIHSLLNFNKMFFQSSKDSSSMRDAFETWCSGIRGVVSYLRELTCNVTPAS